MTKITNRIYILLISFASAMVALVFNLIVPLFGHRLVYSACVCVVAATSTFDFFTFSSTGVKKANYTANEGAFEPTQLERLKEEKNE